MTEGLRAVPDDRQSAVHDADRVRPQRRHASSGRSGSATICGWSSRASRARARRRRSRAGSSRPAPGSCSSPPPIARSTSTTALPASRFRALPLGWPDDGFAVDVRARRAAVPAGDGVSGGRSVGRTRRSKRNRCTSHWHRRVRTARWIALKRRYGAPPNANFVSMPARLSRPSKPVLSTAFGVGLVRRDELLRHQLHQRVVQRDHARPPCRPA